MTWCETKILLGHVKEVYDLRWSLDGKYIVSGSMDDRAILWNVEKVKYIQILEGH